MSADNEFIVIGGGAMGSAAAWSLARRGHGVLLLEQFAEGHTNGSSHGATRNFNLAYTEPHYIQLLKDADRLWSELSAESGTELLNRSGLVAQDDPETLKRTHDALTGAGFDSELLSAATAGERFSGMRFAGQTLYIPGSGQLNADLALASMQRLAREHGAELRHETRVEEIVVQADDRVSVRIRPEGQEAQTLTARHLIVTAGGWASRLLGSMMTLPKLYVTEEHPVHFAQADPLAFWPGFNHMLQPGATNSGKVFGPLYGMLTPGEGVKVGWHASGRVVDPDRRPHELIDEQIRALQEYARRWLPGVDPEHYTTVSCTYTNTEDEDFVLDTRGPITVGAGFSGHGFKFTPAIGDYLAELATGVRSAHPSFSALREITKPVFLDRRRELGLPLN